jgi:nucleoside 2-deoxyribosyltransferase
VSRPKLYLAGPLFSLPEREFNSQLRDMLLPIVDVFLPQQDGDLFVEMVAKGIDVELAARRVFETDLRAIIESDYVLIIMDGRSIDEGAAFELGYASALGKACIGLQTDMRRLLPIGNNPMITGALAHVFSDIRALCAWLTSDVRRKRFDQSSSPTRIDLN